MKLTRLQRRSLVKTGEECGELITAICKKLMVPNSDIYWGGGSLKESITEEVGDVLAIVNFMSREMDLDQEAIAKRVASKTKKYEKWWKKDKKA